MKELLLTIKVSCLQGMEVQGQDCKIVMVPFTGKAYGDYFNGEIIGTGVDTQRYTGNGGASLSARYMLSGADAQGQNCKIFIENSLHDESGWHPVIVTDSKYLSDWEKKTLVATVDGIEGGVLVQIYSESID